MEEFMDLPFSIFDQTSVTAEKLFSQNISEDIALKNIQTIYNNCHCYPLYSDKYTKEFTTSKGWVWTQDRNDFEVIAPTFFQAIGLYQRTGYKPETKELIDGALFNIIQCSLKEKEEQREKIQELVQYILCQHKGVFHPIKEENAIVILENALEKKEFAKNLFEVSFKKIESLQANFLYIGKNGKIKELYQQTKEMIEKNLEYSHLLPNKKDNLPQTTKKVLATKPKNNLQVNLVQDLKSEFSRRIIRKKIPLTKDDFGFIPHAFKKETKPTPEKCRDDFEINYTFLNKKKIKETVGNLAAEFSKIMLQRRNYLNAQNN